MINAGTMETTTTADAGDFAYAPMLMQPYVGFDHGLATIPTDRPPLLHHHHLYDNLDFAAGAPPFPFQDPGSLLSGGGLQPLESQMTMPMAPSPSPLQMPMMAAMPGGVPAAADVYPFGGGGGFVKREDLAVVDVDDGRIGLNLGQRTYFSPADVLAVDRLLMRSRLGGMGMLGLGLGAAAHHHHHPPPRCQAEGCKADLSGAKHYHRRHKVCEYHAKAAAVAAGGKQQRFCQQCSRFHVLAEFDEAKRSCRKRLTEHNRRRRKPSGGAQAKDSRPPSKKAHTSITSSYTSDHKTASATAATAISPNASGISCLQELDSSAGQERSAAAPTTLSLVAAAPLPLHGKDGGGLTPAETMLMMQQVQAAAAAAGREVQDQQQQCFVMTSLVQATHQHGGGGGGSNDGGSANGNILSCSSVSDQQASSCNGGRSNSGSMHFFGVDFM